MIHRQFDFFAKHRAKHQELTSTKTSYGGSDARGLRKVARPLERRRPIHLVLRSTSARGALSFQAARNRLIIESTIREWAERFDVRIQALESSGVNVHIVARFLRRENFQNFLRTITALIARRITGARRGRPFGRRFWDDLVFSRLIRGRRALRPSAAALLRGVSAPGAIRVSEMINEYEDAVRLARRRGVAIGKILEESSA